MNTTKEHEAGFSYLDVMMAITILMVGVMALVSAITGGLTMTTSSQQALTAKQFASSTVEAIYTARDLGPLGWNAVGNVGDVNIPGAVFVTDKQNIYPTPGEDGIVGTADDQAGPDGDSGTADDGVAVPGFQRMIQVADIPDPDRPNSPITLRQIDVHIYYYVGSIEHEETFTSFIANYRTTAN
jgi:hypothetical protein